MRRNKELGLIIVLVGVVGLVGCAHEDRMYEPSPPDLGGQSLPLKVAVVEFEDRNPPGKQNVPGGWLIPGYLYAFRAELHHPTTFGKCFARELRASGQFSVVKYFSSYDELASSYREYDVLVTGILRHDRLTVNELYYGAWVLTPSLWMFFGLPAYSAERSVQFEVEMREPSQPQTVKLTRSVSFGSSDHWGIGVGKIWNWNTDERILWESWKNDEREFGAPSYYSQDLDGSDFCPTRLMRRQLLDIRREIVKAAAFLANGQTRGEQQAIRGGKP